MGHTTAPTDAALLDSWPLVEWLLDTDAPPPHGWLSAQRVSFADVATRVDVGGVLTARRALACRIDLATITSRLGSKHSAAAVSAEATSAVPLAASATHGFALRPLLVRMATGSHAEFEALLGALDCVAAAEPPLIAARTFATIAEALALRAAGRGGLRSGPASNAIWTDALWLLRSGDVRGASRALADVRRAWLGEAAAQQPRLLVRAARHYEGAVAECISLCVRTCTIERPPRAPALPIGVWVTCEAPARIDLAGGWTDTPPVCYEAGGCVVNAAVTVDGRCPIGARARRIAAPQIVITTDPALGPMVCTSLADLEDHCSPLAPGALPKTVLLFCGLVRLHDPSSRSLRQQLAEAGGGIEIESWSQLPTGSGMGTSSILAATLVACVGRAMGVAYDADMLVHAVLQVEQMLTTGGGWQDQAGGVFGGIKRCASEAALPLQVTTTVLPVPREDLRTLTSHLQLVYTGKTRLARNLLQDVLRRWYSAHPAILANVEGLVSNAAALEAAITALDLPAIGCCLDTYWAQKKVMCDAEPPAVTRMLSKLRPLCHGASLAGAGGGGFMLLVTKEPNARAAVECALDDEPCTVHAVALHEEGLQTRLDGPAEE